MSPEQHCRSSGGKAQITGVRKPDKKINWGIQRSGAGLLQRLRSAVVDFLHKNTDTARRLEQRILSNERLRKELNTVKKEAKAAAKKIAIKIHNLKDCKYHLQDGPKGENSTVFITEGQSASGSMVFDP